MFDRRKFLMGLGGVLLPVPEPVRSYSFVGGWARESLEFSPPQLASVAVSGDGLTITLTYDKAIDGWNAPFMLSVL